jgi:hypothetical protein
MRIRDSGRCFESLQQEFCNSNKQNMAQEFLVGKEKMKQGDSRPLAPEAYH